MADLPVDPDLEVPSRPGVFPAGVASRWPRIHWASVLVVFGGGFFGGLVRYTVGLVWPAPAGAFPWGIFLVNIAGAFILSLLLVLVRDVLPPTTYLRPALGTGFCGALTTFSSVTTAVDELVAHAAPGVALAYLVASLAAGLAVVFLGVALGRAIAARRPRDRG